MKNDTQVAQKEIDSKFNDPLGLKLLGEAVANLTQLKDQNATMGKSSEWAAYVDQLADGYDTVATKYELLRDRYSLLKRSNSQLHDELVWLRDQFDDLCSLSSSELKNHIDENKNDTTPQSTRYEDRWPK